MFWSLRICFSFSSLSMILVVRFSNMSCSKFSYENLLTFVQRFLWVYWIDLMLLSFILLIWYITLLDLPTVRHPFYPSDKSQFTAMYNQLLMCGFLYLICEFWNTKGLQITKAFLAKEWSWRHNVSCFQKYITRLKCENDRSLILLK